ncbi:MAG: Na/Pi symporter [Phycisphaerae bacterium]
MTDQQPDFSIGIEGEHEGPIGQLFTAPPWLRAALAILAIYLFISSVNMIGSGLKVIAKDPAGDSFLQWLFGMVDQPLAGLFIGLLVTSLVQSSSFTTSMTVGLVGAGEISLTAAIPIVMGANVGTSVTNLLVSLAHVRRRREFRRSLAGAIVHDFFNVLAVIVLLPLEWAFGLISHPTQWFAARLGESQIFSSDPTKQMGVLKQFFGFMAKGFKWLMLDVLGLSDKVGGAVVAVLALLLLFVALGLLVKVLRALMQSRLSDVFSRTLFRRPAIAFVVGIVLTAAVQSSSVTTSLVVPLVGAGILKLRQIYPYTLGANIGTTLTAILAALGTGNAFAMACAMGHLLFNLFGTMIFWPLQFIPISLAKGFAKMASRRRYLAIAYIIVLFFVIPIIVVVLTNLWKG